MFGILPRALVLMHSTMFCIVLSALVLLNGTKASQHALLSYTLFSCTCCTAGTESGYLATICSGMSGTEVGCFATRHETLGYLRGLFAYAYAHTVVQSGALGCEYVCTKKTSLRRVFVPRDLARSEYTCTRETKRCARESLVRVRGLQAKALPGTAPCSAAEIKYKKAHPWYKWY
eukprot:681157-Rhodomonas_salina.2